MRHSNHFNTCILWLRAYNCQKQFNPPFYKPNHISQISLEALHYFTLPVITVCFPFHTISPITKQIISVNFDFADHNRTEHNQRMSMPTNGQIIVVCSLVTITRSDNHIIIHWLAQLAKSITNKYSLK
jgi:hypothetical protein